MTGKHTPTSISDLVKSFEARLRASRDQSPPCAPTEPVCDHCSDTGWAEVYDDRGVRRVRRCSCRTESRSKAAPGVPIHFQDATLANYQETPASRHALKAARQWVAHPTRDVYLWGSVGTGKTRLAASMLNDVFRSRSGGYFTRVPMFLVKLQPSNGGHTDLLEHCYGAPVLVLDDVGAERESATDFTRRTLFMLYEERGDRGLPTIWTGNKSLSELGDFMQDERLSSRISGRAMVVEIAGQDWRVSKRAR
jgi:DNA replication protein DnaC